MQSQDGINNTSADDMARQIGEANEEKVVDFSERRARAVDRVGEIEDYIAGASADTDFVSWQESPTKPKLVAEVRLNGFSYLDRSNYLRALREARENVQRLTSLRNLRGDVDISPEDIPGKDDSLEDEDDDSPELLRYKSLSRKIAELENAPDDIDVSINMVMLPNMVWWNAKKIDPQTKGTDKPAAIPITFERKDMKASLSVAEINGLSKAIFDRVTGDKTSNYKGKRGKGKSKRRQS